MTHLNLLLLAFICYAYAVPFRNNSKLKVMSFNIWQSGRVINDGLRKAADQIKHVDPDVVALQEAQSTSDVINRLVKMLGSEWSGVQHCAPEKTDHDGQVIVTKHKIIGYDHTKAGMNLRIRLNGSGREISVWSMHLEYKNFAPDKILEKESIEKILNAELEQNKLHGRLYNIIELIKHPKFVEQIMNTNNVPVIVAGDFNTPSDLDYIEATKNTHLGYVVEFPVTKLLRTVAGMTDSYREVHPNPVTHPGATWPVYEIDRDTDDLTPRIKDRIDYIFFRGPLSTIKSEPFSGITPIVDDRGESWRNNEYPSDHFSLISEFEVYDGPIYPVPPSFEIPREYAAFDHSYETLEECSLNIVQ